MTRATAATPPGLLGMLLRMAYKAKKYHSGTMCAGVVSGLAWIELSGWPRAMGVKKAYREKPMAPSTQPTRSLIPESVRKALLSTGWAPTRGWFLTGSDYRQCRAQPSPRVQRAPTNQRDGPGRCGLTDAAECRHGIPERRRTANPNLAQSGVDPNVARPVPGLRRCQD